MFVPVVRYRTHCHLAAAVGGSTGATHAFPPTDTGNHARPLSGEKTGQDMAKKRRARKIDGQWVYHNPVVSLAPAPWDHGATGAANRIGLVIEPRGDVDPATGKESNPNRVTGARRVDMLEIYRKREVISQRGYNAGLVLRDAWSKTEMGAACPFARDAVDCSLKIGEIISVMIDRISAYRSAAKHRAPGDEQILSVVVCDGNAVGQIREYRATMHDAGLMLLHDALERLADSMEGRRVSH